MYTDFCGWYPYYWCNYPTPNQVMGIPVSGGLQTTLQTQIDRLTYEVNRQMLNCYQEMGGSAIVNKINYCYCVNDFPAYTLEDCPKATKVDIFETLNLLIFPYDPIRDWTKKKVTEINERFKPLEKALGI